MKKNAAWFVVPFGISNAIIFAYRNMDGIFGYTFQQNRGLAGGYLCVAIALLFCLIWYVCITISNKKGNQAIESICSVEWQQNVNMKKVAITIFALQSIILSLYFTTLLALINPPMYIVLPIWFAIGIAGIVVAIMLLVKRKHFALAIGQLLLGLAIVFIGGLMRLFMTM